MKVYPVYSVTSVVKIFSAAGKQIVHCIEN
jgi:hypothetical protein